MIIWSLIDVFSIHTKRNFAETMEHFLQISN